MECHKSESRQATGQSPLYRQIEETLRERIKQGIWLTGQALPTRRELCSEFGTTHVTLDKAIEGLIREGLVRATRGSGTFVSGTSVSDTSVSDTSPVPRALRIGVIIKRNDQDETLGEHWDENFYFGPLFRGIRDGVTGKPVEIIYSHLQRNDYESFYRSTALDGMILVIPPLEDLPTLHMLADAGAIFVTAGFSTDDPADDLLPCVDTDNRQGAFDAVSHLLDLGHQRIAIVNLVTAHTNHHDRLEGNCRALAARGMSVAPDDLVLYPRYTVARFDQQIEAWVKRACALQGLPTAIFACDYIMTLATLRVLRKHGLSVPDDISVVGFDDPLSAAHLTPPLTTVRQPVYQLGLSAAQRLLDAIQQGTLVPAVGKQILPNALIIRESTSRPRLVKAIKVQEV